MRAQGSACVGPCLDVTDAGRHVSQEKLAELAGLHRTYASSVERGERNISLVNIERLAIALGVSMGSLLR